MIITKRHYRLIERMLEKWSGGLPLDKGMDELTDDDLEYLTHLELAGLVREQEDGFELTQAGNLLAEALKECIAYSEGKDDNFRILGSEVISMIEVARLAQGDVQAQPDIAGELQRRGLVQDGRLLPVAESILQAYEIAQPNLYITPELAEKLRKQPPGPGKKTLLNFTREETFRLEAMRLLTFSLPVGNTYSLSGAGQQIRAGLLKGAVVDFALTVDMLKSLLAENPTGRNKEQLLRMGAIDQHGNLLPAGRHLKKAAQLLLQQPIELNPSIDIETFDFSVLALIERLWQENKKDAKKYPSYKQIRDNFISSEFTPANPAYALYLLESFGLISSKRIYNGSLVYELTEWGEKILADRKKEQHKPVHATSVMAITTTRMENLSPDENWIKTAEEQGIVGKGFPTNSGRLFSGLASSIERLPVISALEGEVLRILPLWRGMFEKTILDHFQQDRHEQVRYALRKLVSQGIVDALPGALYKVTEAGERFKRGVAVVPPRIEFQVTPHILRLLISANQAQERGKIDWRAAERNCELDPQVFASTIDHARNLHYIKGDKITTAGQLLIEGTEILRQVRTFWEEIEI